MVNVIHQKPGVSSIQNLGQVLDKVPPEAIVKAVEIVADVLRANKVMEARDQEFEHELTILQEGNLDRKERLRLLIDLVARTSLPDDAQSRIIDSICNIAEGSS